MRHLTKQLAFLTLAMGSVVVLTPDSLEAHALIETKTASTVFTAGEGTEASPYLISSVEDLVALGTEVNAGNSMDNTYFKLTQNLDLSPIENWMPIGTSVAKPFSGIFDGGGYTLSGLTINRPTTEYVGLFGYVGSVSTRTRISNLTLTNAQIVGSNYTGALAGYAYQYVSLNTISVSGSVSGAKNTGGMLGYSSGSNSGVALQNVSFEGDVTGTSYVGGLAGSVASTFVRNASVNASVKGSREGIGGLVGSISSNSTLEQSESSGSVV